MTYTYATDNRLLTRPTTTPTCAEFRRYVTDQAGMRLAELDSLSGYAGLQSAMTYTAAGQLYYAVTPRAAAGPYDHAWHWYDAGGRRMMSHVASGSTLGASVRPDSSWGTRTYYLNDGDDVGLTLVKGSGPTWRYHQRYLLTGLDEMAALRLSLNGTPTNLAVVSDRQGSFLMAVEASGAEKSEAGFYLTGPFGQLESGSAAATDGGTHAGLGFTGAGTATAAGGYVYLRNRWYDPKTGRFLSQDPIGLAGGVNLYAYAGNNPIAFEDPFGLDAVKVIFKRYQVTLGHVFGKKVTAPLGHGGVISIDDKGRTRYYEYGRYGSSHGDVRRRTVPDVFMGEDGRPTDASLKKLYDYVSKHYGQGKEVEAEYHEDADAAKVNAFAEQRKNDPDRAAYDLLTNNCKTFATEAIEAGKN